MAAVNLINTGTRLIRASGDDPIFRQSDPAFYCLPSQALQAVNSPMSLLVRLFVADDQRALVLSSASQMTSIMCSRIVLSLRGEEKNAIENVSKDWQINTCTPSRTFLRDQAETLRQSYERGRLLRPAARRVKAAGSSPMQFRPRMTSISATSAIPTTRPLRKGHFRIATHRSLSLAEEDLTFGASAFKLRQESLSIRRSEGNSRTGTRMIRSERALRTASTL